MAGQRAGLRAKGRPDGRAKGRARCRGQDSACSPPTGAEWVVCSCSAKLAANEEQMVSRRELSREVDELEEKLNKAKEDAAELNRELNREVGDLRCSRCGWGKGQGRVSG